MKINTPHIRILESLRENAAPNSLRKKRQFLFFYKNKNKLRDPNNE